MEPSAGSVAVSLGGLFDALYTQGVESQTLALCDCAPANRDAAVSTVEKADIVHFHGWGDRRARMLATAARAASRPYLIAPHGALSRGAYGKRNIKERLRAAWAGRSVLRHAATVVAVNGQELRELTARRVHANITTLSYGVSVADYNGSTPAPDDLPEPPDGNIALVLAPVHPIEGVVPLLKAFAELGPLADGWCIVFAGTDVGDWRKMLEAAVRRKGGENRVLFASAADVATQRAWLSRASLLVSPRLHTGVGSAVLQAVVSGVPAIASFRVTPPALVDLVDVCGPERHELKRALRKFFERSNADRRSAADLARQAARQRVDWPVLVEGYIRLYRSLV